MVSAVYNRVIYGAREVGHVLWRDQIDKYRNERKAREIGINFREVLNEVKREKSNLNPVLNEQFLRPANEMLSPAERMKTIDRETVMLASKAYFNPFIARVNLAKKVNEAIFFARPF